MSHFFQSTKQKEALECEILATSQIPFEQLPMSTLIGIPIQTAGALLTACRETEGLILIGECRMLPNPSRPGRRPDGNRPRSFGGIERPLSNIGIAWHGSGPFSAMKMGISWVSYQ